MHTTENTTNQKTKNDPAHDLGQIIKKRKYKGKYPERIYSISSGYRDNAYHYVIEINSGGLFNFNKKHSKAGQPAPGQEIEMWIISIDPINEEGEKIARKYLFNL